MSEARTHVKTIPLRPGLWKTLEGRDHLIASRCPLCQEIFFPRKEKGLCINCQHKGLEEITLSTTGTIYSYTIVMQRPPSYYEGPVPYALAWIELPEGVRLESLLTECDPDKLEIGMPVALVIEKLHTDAEGNEITTYKFKPADGTE